MLREADAGDQQPDEDNEGSDLSGGMHRLGVQPELGDCEAEPSERDRGSDVGEQRVVVRQQISQPGLVAAFIGDPVGDSSMLFWSHMPVMVSADPVAFPWL